MSSHLSYKETPTRVGSAMDCWDGRAIGVDDLTSLSHQELVALTSNLITAFPYRELLQVAQYMIRTRDEIMSAVDGFANASACAKSPPSPQFESQESWDSHFLKLEEYKNKYGHCKITRFRDTGKYKKLRIWTDNQVRLYVNNQLPKHRLDRLTEVGFWTPVAPKCLNELEGKSKAEIWDYQFNKLLEYIQKYGDVNVSVDHDDEFPGLREWGYGQRKAFKRGGLAEDKVKKLRDVGFELDRKGRPDEMKGMNPDQIWEYRYRQLEDYRNEYGNCNVPQKRAEWKTLGSYVRRQRELRKNGLLPRYRFERLDQLGFEWDRKGKSNVR